MKKKKIIAFIFLLLVGTAVIFFAAPGPRPQVVGELSSADLAKIQRVIHHAIWRGAVPNFSWQSFAHLPADIRERFSQRIQRVESLPNGIVRATITTGKRGQTLQLRAAYYDLILRNGPRGWEILSAVGDVGPDASMMRGF